MKTFDKDRCRERIWDNWHYHQCSRKVAVERNGIGYCKQHDPVAVKAKRAAREAEWNAKWERRVLNGAVAAHRDAWTVKAIDALRQIAAGHNDPGTLAREVLAEEEYRPQ